jgi:hypothetical protein
MTDKQPAAHFLLTSATTWCTTGGKYTLSEAIKIMDKERITYFIWFVPLPHNARYEINFFAPQVDGAYAVEMVEFKNGRRVKATTKE